RHDRGWMGLDEWHKAGKELATRMARVDDDGVAEITKIQEARAMARVRKIRLANCIDSRGTWVEMDSKVYGIEHALPIMSSYENLRRIDIVLGFGESQELLKLITQSNHEINPGGSEYPKADCRMLIHWAASRRAEQIAWEPGAEDLLIKVANHLAERYHSDLPVMIVSDARWKVARLSAGVALRLFSTEDGEICLVKKKHVEFVEWLYRTIYDSEELSVDKYATAWRRKSDSDLEALRMSMKKIQQHNIWLVAFNSILDTPTRFSGRELAEFIETSGPSIGGSPVSPKEWVSSFIKCMRRENMVTRVGTFYSMTAKGIKLAKMALADQAAIENGDENTKILTYRDNLIPKKPADTRTPYIDYDEDEGNF
ncbi:MAG: hypothetical protein ACE5FA_06075, partial [Dehalococcoidia bacterium]